MNNITTKQFQILTDNQLVWELMVDNFEPLFANGVAAPFFEYALTSSWMDKRFVFLDRLWMDGERAVGFVFYEDDPNCVLFHLRRGYEFLAPEMVKYAVNDMHGTPDKRELTFFPGQKALMDEAAKLGFSFEYSNPDMCLDFSRKTLDYPLPGGFHFVDSSQGDPVKLARCMWKGFDHEDKGPFENWDAPDPGTPWNPQKGYLGVISSTLCPPPHSTYQYNVIIADENDEYACFSGMWFVAENNLAYMEPLCTVPEHRHKGLAAAALSEHYCRLKPLGARYMTGGENEFYKKIGYDLEIEWQHWKKADK